MRNRNRLFTLLALAALPLHSGRAEDLSTGLGPEQLREIEDAVDRGLRWLSMQQNGDGSFSCFLYNGEKGPGLHPTCFAVLAFLSSGHQPGQGRYGAQISRAVEFILSARRSDGSFSQRPPKELPFADTHALCGLTLSEIYGASSGVQAEEVARAITRALAFSRRIQETNKLHPAFRGGWKYASRGDGQSRAHLSDIYTTSRELVFLRSAQIAGFEVPQVWVEEGLDFIARCYQPGPAVPPPVVIANGGFAVKQHQGVFRLQPNGPGTPPERWGNQWNVNRTASGMLALQYHGRRDDPMVRRSADWLAENSIPRQGSKNQTAFYYQCYISSQAMAQVGGERWENYFPRVVRTLLPYQDRGGHWRTDIVALPNIPRGRHRETLGPEYNTALAVLCLTLPDQLLPIHQQ